MHPLPYPRRRRAVETPRQVLIRALVTNLLMSLCHQKSHCLSMSFPHRHKFSPLPACSRHHPQCTFYLFIILIPTWVETTNLISSNPTAFHIFRPNLCIPSPFHQPNGLSTTPVSWQHFLLTLPPVPVRDPLHLVHHQLQPHLPLLVPCRLKV